MHTPPLKIGLFAIGLEAYWPQFPELKRRLENYLLHVNSNLRNMHSHIINAGMVDTIDKAFETGCLFRSECVDIIFLYVSTYALSSTVLPVVQAAKVPVIILNLSPQVCVDYVSFNALPNRTEKTGEWLSHCSACTVPEIANVFLRTGIQFSQVTGMLYNDDVCWSEIAGWVAAAKTVYTMRHNRLGCLGHYYSGMLDIYTDLTSVYAHFGGHIDIIEIEELSELRTQVSHEQAAQKLSVFHSNFDIENGCSPEELGKAAITAAALDALVAKYKLGSLAYYYKGTSNSDNEAAIDSIIPGNSLLTARGIPVAGEYEIKNALAMKIMDSFDAGGSFTEYYAVDYNANVVLMGHDGPAHIAMAEGKPKIKPLQIYHGKTGSGLSVEMSVKNGPVTLLSVVQKKDGNMFLLVAEAEIVAGPVLEIGNTNSRYKFPVGVKEFMDAWNMHGPAHHCAVGIGHLASKLKKFAVLMNMELVQVC